METELAYISSLQKYTCLPWIVDESSFVINYNVRYINLLRLEG